MTYTKKITYNEETIWRTIPNTNERYKISNTGIIIDLVPGFSWGKQPRELESTNNFYCVTNARGQRVHKHINTFILETFPDLYRISDTRKKEIKEKINIQDSITYTVDEFNKLIYPNKVLYIYNKYDNDRYHWKKPQKISIKDNKTFTLHKKYKYFGVGTTHLIKFDGLFPKNAKPYADLPQKQYVRDTYGKSSNPNTELFNNE